MTSGWPFTEPSSLSRMWTLIVMLPSRAPGGMIQHSRIFCTKAAMAVADSAWSLPCSVFSPLVGLPSVVASEALVVFSSFSLLRSASSLSVSSFTTFFGFSTGFSAGFGGAGFGGCGLGGGGVSSIFLVRSASALVSGGGGSALGGSFGGSGLASGGGGGWGVASLAAVTSLSATFRVWSVFLISAAFLGAGFSTFSGASGAVAVSWLASVMLEISTLIASTGAGS